MTSGAQCRRLGEDDVVAGSGTASQVWGWCLHDRRCHWLGSGKMVVRNEAQPWSGTMTWRLHGGLDDGVEAPRRTRRRHGLRGGR
jgi:hypothetical protein